MKKSPADAGLFIAAKATLVDFGDHAAYDRACL